MIYFSFEENFCVKCRFFSYFQISFDAVTQIWWLKIKIYLLALMLRNRVETNLKKYIKNNKRMFKNKITSNFRFMWSNFGIIYLFIYLLIPRKILIVRRLLVQTVLSYEKYLICVEFWKKIYQRLLRHSVYCFFKSVFNKN